MNEKPNKVDVRFHFPYASISLVTHKEIVSCWKTLIRSGKAFDVQDGPVEYTINPELLTYMEVRPSVPF